MNDNDGAKLNDALPKDVALTWSIRMRGEVTESLQGEFEQWLAESPRHRQAYDRYSRVMGQAEILKSPGQADEASSAKLARRASKRWLMVGAAAAAVIVFAITISASGSPIPGPGVVLSARAAEPLATERGEIRSFKLDDGSTATLDSDTRVEVSISPDARHLRVAQGRARMNVVNDVRPFRVVAGQGIVTTNEGVVDVMINGDREVVVELISGKADLASTTRVVPAATQPRPLQGGTAVLYRADDKQVRPTTRESRKSSLEWPSGWSVHRSIALNELISEANRYAPVPIIVEDSNLAKREISGRFKINDTEMFLKHIAGLFDLTIHQRPDGVYLRSQ